MGGWPRLCHDGSSAVAARPSRTKSYYMNEVREHMNAYHAGFEPGSVAAKSRITRSGDSSYGGE